MHTPIPDIPGDEVDPVTTTFLSQHVSGLCGLRSNMFPGSQPVSFQQTSLDMLENMNFWVCEKSDGVRLLIFVVMNGQSGLQEVFLIDRKQRFFRIDGLHFPHYEKAGEPLTDTIIDGELVTDIDPRTGRASLRFYAFDCLVINGENIMAKPLEKRFGRLRAWVMDPFKRGLEANEDWQAELPFDLVAKTQELAYHIKQVLDVHIPKLEHGHDGLIFTCAESAYVAGTDEKILKWKPPSENSIDFKLELRFPSASAPHEPDMTAKPAFVLSTWLGGDRYEFFDTMDVSDDEWESWKESNIQYDDRIIECCWSIERSTWQFMRIRDDKQHANHKSIMEKILISIQDGVEIEALLARSDAIRIAWKARQGRSQARPPPPAAQSQAPRPGNSFTGGLRR